MLKEIFAIQRKFNESLSCFTENKTEQEKVEWISKWCTYMHQEISKFLDWFPYKHWSKRSGNKLITDKEMWTEGHLREAKLELVDTMCFFVSACQEIGMSADELFHLYKEKMGVNYERQTTGKY